MHIVASIRTEIIQGIVAILTSHHALVQVHLVIYSLLLMGVLVVCGFISYYVRKMSRKIHKNAAILVVQNAKLDVSEFVFTDVD